MPAPPYDILRRDAAGTAIWVEAVADLEVAKARIFHLAERYPAEYLIFRLATSQIVATFAFKPSHFCPIPASTALSTEKGSSAT